jgi:hypothetical protein
MEQLTKLDKYKLKKAIRDAEITQEFLDSEKTKALWGLIETDITQMWANSASSDAEGREMCYRELHGLKALRQRLINIIKEGRKAEEELKHEQSNKT